jgi:hypothetical protein
VRGTALRTHDAVGGSMLGMRGLLGQLLLIEEFVGAGAWATVCLLKKRTILGSLPRLSFDSPLSLGLGGTLVGRLLWPAVVVHAVYTLLLGRAWLGRSRDRVQAYPAPVGPRAC